MERIITVEGQGTCESAPDAVCFECSMSGRDGDHAEAVRMSAECASPLREALVSAGFPADSLKTVSVSVRPVYENVREDDAYRTEFAGFEYDHRLRLEVPSDGQEVGRVMDAMLSTGVQFSMSYRLADPSVAEESARRGAVEDAKAKAMQLASAAGVRLGEIVSISYGSGGDAPPFRTMAMRANAPDMVPESITVTDSVTVSWIIL